MCPAPLVRRAAQVAAQVAARSERTRRPRSPIGTVPLQSLSRPAIAWSSEYLTQASTAQTHTTMSGFGGGQDWSTVNAGRSAKAFVKPTAGDKKKDLMKAQRVGGAVSQQKIGGGGNSTVAGHGMMGTTAGSRAASDTASFRPRVRARSFVAASTPLPRRRRRAEDRGRDGDVQGAARGPRPRQGAHASAHGQEDVAEGPRHQDQREAAGHPGARPPAPVHLCFLARRNQALPSRYESGKAVPNPQIIGKIERALGVKLPRPKKVKKVAE